ncbi:aminoacyl-histidine dipeptidase [Salibacteraceae bacterium]|nr:aminoacyl-histidine dipeptidase [Salibacteraceae bacterium]
MSEEVRKLEPKAMWNHFADLNAVPRPSKKEERVIEFVKSFGESLGLPTMVDEVGNIIIKKPGSAGMENKTTIVMQSHIDMVHQKNNDTVFDFDTEGIKMYVEGDWVKADGTTLGSDNGIGVASIMAVLSSSDIAHPPIEALFTIDEETGMTGAMGLKGGLLDAKIMLNLDTEDDDELTIGCAGGIDVTANGTYSSEPAGSGISSFKLTLNGLTGGHSGMDIHRGRGNANKLMNRVLWEATKEFDVRIRSIDGGSLRNAIPRESIAFITVSDANLDAFTAAISAKEAELKEEHNTTDPHLKLAMESTEAITTVMAKKDAAALMRAIYACPLGIYRMSPDIDGLVQTSNNVARILVQNGQFTVQCLTRSSVDSEKMDEAEMIKCVFEQIGANVDFGGSYPGWTPKPGADIVKVMSATYKELFNEEAHVMACHAGLECGILGTNYPDMEMISFGPNIRGAHSPDEKVQISSVHKYWKLLMETLKRID